MKKLNRITHNTTFLLILSFILTFIITGCSSKNKDDNSKSSTSTINIDILQVGKADAIIINDSEHTIVIDCGESDDGAKVVSKLKEMKVEKIDYLIITHFDKDHVGGAAEVINSFKVDELLEPYYTPDNPDSDEYVSYRAAIEKNHIIYTALESDFEFSVGDMSFNVMSANGESFKNNIDNNNSLMIGLEHDGNSFLFAGDVEKERIKDILKTDISTYDFLKVPHHGNYNAGSEAFLSAISPKYAVITCSDKNPADERIVDILNKLNCKVYYTTKGGLNVTSTSEGIDIKQ